MTQRYGWAPVGTRVIDSVAGSRLSNATLLCGLRLTGLCVPMVIDGALTKPHFLAYLRRILLPVLKSAGLFVMDNLPPHTLARVRTCLAQHDIRALCLPPYSLDFNPIEQAFSQIKATLRRQRLRTVDELGHAFGQPLDWVTPTQAANYFRNAGYLPE